MTAAKPPVAILGLDVGTVRVGVALARLDVGIAQPLVTLERCGNSDDIFKKIAAIAQEQAVDRLIVGWPRGLQGQSTKQTLATEQFSRDLQQQTGLTVSLQDEALTSQKAEAELQSRGKPYQKGDIDALAATYILEDFLQANTDSRHV